MRKTKYWDDPDWQRRGRHGSGDRHVSRAYSVRLGSDQERLEDAAEALGLAPGGVIKRAVLEFLDRRDATLKGKQNDAP